MKIAREMDAFRNALKKRGLSDTWQREAIAREVFSTHDHFTADDLHRVVKKKEPRIGRVTVYRTLNFMVESGLVEERQFQKNRVLYEHVIGHAHHDHMVCVDCGRIGEFQNEVIEREQDRTAARHGFTLLHHSHTLFGKCGPCGKKPRRRSRRPAKK